MNAAISELQTPFLDSAQLAASRLVMGLDTQLIDDRTYFVVEADGCLAGCGGWSRRRTLDGGDQSPGRSDMFVELMATLAGEPLYRACGYSQLEATTDERGGAAVPLLRMHKEL